MTRSPAAALVIDEGQRVALEGLATSQAAPHRQVQQAKAMLLVGEGVANSHIAQRIGVSVGTVFAWRNRFAEDGLAKLGQVCRWRGRKPSISGEQVAEIIELILHFKPKGHTHRSCRTMADTGGSSSSGRTPQPVEAVLQVADHEQQRGSCAPVALHDRSRRPPYPRTPAADPPTPWNHRGPRPIPGWQHVGIKRGAEGHWSLTFRLRFPCKSRGRRRAD